MIRLYPGSPTVRPGDLLRLHVSSSTPKFQIAVYRQEEKWIGPLAVVNGLQGYDYGLGPHDSDFGWPAHHVQIPEDWPSAVYVAVASPDGSQPPTELPDDPGHAAALFVVKCASPGQQGKILYKLPLFTYHAYNQLGDPAGCLYTGDAQADGSGKVSMARPGGGVGGAPWDAYYPDNFDGSSPRQTYPHWDQKFISWLYANDYDVEFCTDLDVHQNLEGMLSNYRLVVSVGHDEYWSSEMRENLEAFRDAGGNLAFFSGNVCWWRVHLVDQDTAFVCWKGVAAASGGPYDQWWCGEADDPENSLTGVSYRNAGGWWAGPRPSLGYNVQYPHHWVFDKVVRANGSPLQSGDVIGGAAGQALVGYECDGAALGGVDFAGNLMAALGDGTPSNFIILGHARLSPDWQDRPEGGDNSAATMGVYQEGGTVFTGATTDWARNLHDFQVAQITRNVLNRLGAYGVPILGFGGMCSGKRPVEGTACTFYANLSALPWATYGNLKYTWHATAGTPKNGNQPTFTLTLPSPPEPVTITVSILRDSAHYAMGSLTFLPITTDLDQRLDWICKVRKLAKLASRFSPIAVGARDKHPPFVDPIWDPLRGEMIKLSPQSVERILEAAEQVLTAGKKMQYIRKLRAK